MKKHRLFCAAMWLAVCMLLCGCASTTAGGGAYMVQDGFGEPVRFEARPVRIYANTVNLEDFTLALAGPERMAAVSAQAQEEGSLCREQARHVATVLTGEPSVENILALQPDLIIWQEREASDVATLREMGLRVLALPVGTNKDIIAERIRIIAAAVGEEKIGAQLQRDMEMKLARVRRHFSSVPESARPIGIAYSAQGAFGSAGGLMHSLLTDAGLRNGAQLAGLKRSEHLTKEAVVAVQPDYFILPTEITVTSGVINADELASRVLNDPAYRTLPAIVHQGVVRLPDRYRYCNSHHYADGVVIVHEAVYGPLPQE